MRTAKLATEFFLMGVVMLLFATAACDPCCLFDVFCPPPPTQPDLTAIEKVVNDAYRSEGFDRPVLFLEISVVCNSIQSQCDPCDPSGSSVPPVLKASLETDLQVKVRSLSEADLTDSSVPALTPVLLETGEVGVSVSIDRFTEEDDGYWHGNVTIARSGLDSTIVDYVLERGDGGWAIIDPAPGDLDQRTLDARIRAADHAEVVEGHPDFDPTIVLLDEYAGDLEMTFYILDNMRTWRACRWRLAARQNPQHLDEICDRMAETLRDEVLPHEVEACYRAEGCLLR